LQETPLILCFLRTTPTIRNYFEITLSRWRLSSSRSSSSSVTYIAVTSFVVIRCNVRATEVWRPLLYSRRRTVQYNSYNLQSHSTHVAPITIYCITTLYTLRWRTHSQ